MIRSRIPLYILLLAAAAAAAVAAVPPAAEESDGCSHFTWDVTHELAVMKQAPTAVTASSSASATVPKIEVDTLYDLKLSSQAGVSYAVKPAKPTLNDSAQGGVVRFHTPRGGLYRVSLTSGHWIDIVDGGQVVRSKDFQGSRGCARPHKIVEYELPADKDLVLQLSGGTEATVTVAITSVETASAVPTSAPSASH